MCEGEQSFLPQYSGDFHNRFESLLCFFGYISMIHDVRDLYCLIDYDWLILVMRNFIRLSLNDITFV